MGGKGGEEQRGGEGKELHERGRQALFGTIFTNKD